MRKKLSTVIMGSLLVGIIAGMIGCSGGGSSAVGTLPPPIIDPPPPPPPPVNTPPVALNDIAVTAMNTPVDIAVLANDSDHNGDPLTVTTVSPVSHGTVSINSVGTVHYIPTTGFMGLDSFTYSIADGRGGVATAAVSITVTFPNGLPVERVSVATSVSQDNSNSWMGAISLDGRYVVYRNNATVLGVTKGNILLRDRLTSQTILVSSDKTGISGNQSSQQPVLSGDGSYIAFSSLASNLVPGDTNGRADVFVKNVLTGDIERVSVASDGSQGDGESYAPSISADGRYVAFLSTTSNFFPGDSASSWDIFIYDRQTGQTKHVDSGVRGGDSNNGPSISGDGRYVAYAKTVIESFPPILTYDPFYYGTHVFIYDQQTGRYENASNYYVDGTLALLFFSGDGASGYPSISGNGRYVAYTSLATNLVSGDTNGVRDVFVYDRSLIFNTQIPRVSVASDGTQGNGAVTDLERPSISSDGRFVAFTSSASNLVPTDTNGFPDTFVHDMATGQTRRVSVSASGIEANGSSSDGVLVSISANGGYVVFSSGASNLVTGDTNGFLDVFIAPNPLVQ